jgi:hypothetical protein
MNRRDFLKIGFAETVAAMFNRPLAAAPSPGLPASNKNGNTFEVRGNKLLWGQEPIRLIGVGVGDPIYIRKGRSTPDYLILKQDWNCNVVRICLHPGHWANAPQSSLAALWKEVRAARNYGLFVIIDWKAIGFPDSYVEKPDPSWGLPENAYASDYDLAAHFWETIADVFGQDPGILFELWNEPTVDPNVWVSTGKHWPLLKSLWLRLLKIIRQKSQNIVVVAGSQWAHDLKGVAADLIDDPGVIYAWHCYPPANRNIPDGWLDSLDGLASRRPIIVSEWGFCSNCADNLRGTITSFGKPFTQDILEALELHSTAWCWSPGAAPQMLLWDWQTPTEFGGFVKSYLQTAYQPFKQP